MIFTAFDVSSLSQSLHRWEIAEYSCEALVVIACAGELVADFFTRLPEKVRKHIGTWSTIVLILALAGGLKCLIKTNELSGSVIGSLGDKSEEAGLKANTATTNSETALIKSWQALDEANTAREAAGNAQKVSGAVASKAVELDRQLTATKTQLDTVAAKRDELEKSLINMAVCNAPRVIPQWMADGKTNADPLLPMAGEKVFIEFVPDAEARRAALNLERILFDAKWDVQIPLRVVDGLRDGVSVQPSMARTEPVQNEGPQNINAYFYASNVADKLVDFLHSYNWQAKRGWPEAAPGKLLHDPNVLPAGTIRIQIGLYPPVEFVSPPGAKDITESNARFEQHWQGNMKKLEEEELKVEEKMTKDLTPQQAAYFRANWEHRKAERKAESDLDYKRSHGPCQTLSEVTPRIDP
jgi:hypothetical protein